MERANILICKKFYSEQYNPYGFVFFSILTIKTGNRLQGLIVEKDKSLNLRGMWCNPIEMR